MTTSLSEEPKPVVAPLRRARLWPGVVLTAIFWGLNEGLKYFSPGTPVQVNVLFFGPFVLAALFLIWWLFLSRLSWREKVIPLAVLLIAAAITTAVAHKSMPFMLMLIGLPAALTAWGIAALALAAFQPLQRSLVTSLAIVGVAVYFGMLRMEGINGSMAAKMQWRWTLTPEDQFLAERAPAAPPAKEVTAEPLTLSMGDWPIFRGAERNSRVTGVKLATDWTKQPPKELWRQRIGPGWSSFAVVANRLFTQEQRGEQEAVVCYDADSGKELWAHEDKSRFDEIVAGAGPRATPTFADGRIYALGAAGVLNCLDAATGKRLWSSDIATDAQVKPPQWGFSSSPLVAEGLVVVFAGAPQKGLLAYSAETGKLAWSAAVGELSYSSAQSVKLGEDPYITIATDAGLTALHPADGSLAWRYEWASPKMARVTQPQFIDATHFLLGSGDGVGTSYVALSPTDVSWQATEVWNTKKFQPDFNDYVVHEGHIYGFDGNIVACLDAATGERKWKKGRYGHGQLLLLADQGVLLILSESGELVLVEANPEKHVELAKHPAVAGKTWNHPVLVGHRLFVRNGEEMAAFELPTAP